jgi:hypothetical protein
MKNSFFTSQTPHSSTSNHRGVRGLLQAWCVLAEMCYSGRRGIAAAAGLVRRRVSELCAVGLWLCVCLCVYMAGLLHGVEVRRPLRWVRPRDDAGGRWMSEVRFHRCSGGFMSCPLSPTTDRTLRRQGSRNTLLRAVRCYMYISTKVGTALFVASTERHERLFLVLSLPLTDQLELLYPADPIGHSPAFQSCPRLSCSRSSPQPVTVWSFHASHYYSLPAQQAWLQVHARS